MHEMDVMPPPGEAINRLVEVGTCALDDKNSVFSKDVVELFSGAMRIEKQGEARDREESHEIECETDVQSAGREVRTSASDQTPGWLIVAMRSEPARSMTRTLRCSPS